MIKEFFKKRRISRLKKKAAKHLHEYQRLYKEFYDNSETAQSFLPLLSTYDLCKHLLFYLDKKALSHAMKFDAILERLRKEKIYVPAQRLVPQDFYTIVALAKGY